MGDRADAQQRHAADNRGYYKRKSKAQYAERRAWLDALKLEQGCSRCGYDTCPSALHFHHLDPSEKTMSVSSMLRHAIATVEEEMAKCILLCANCHAEEEWGA